MLTRTKAGVNKPFVAGYWLSCSSLDPPIVCRGLRGAKARSAAVGVVGLADIIYLQHLDFAAPIMKANVVAPTADRYSMRCWSALAYRTRQTLAGICVRISDLLVTDQGDRSQRAVLG